MDQLSLGGYVCSITSFITVLKLTLRRDIDEHDKMAEEKTIE